MFSVTTTSDPGSPDPPITVLLPLKNHHPLYLRRALDSITSQDCRGWRLLIIVEPADHAGFLAMLQSDLGDSRIALITNRGRRMAGAINTGMQSTDSPFVALLLADDMWSRRAVTVLRADIAAHPAVDFFHSSRVIIDAADRPVSPIYKSRDEFEIGDFKSGSPVKHLLCWRRDLALSLGGLDESLGAIGVDDYDFPWTMAQAGASFKAVHHCLYYYRNHCDCYRLTTHTPLSVNLREVNTILKKHGVDRLTRMLILFRGRRRGSLGGQSLYQSRFHEWLEEKLGRDPRRRWSQPSYQ